MKPSYLIMQIQNSITGKPKRDEKFLRELLSQILYAQPD